MASPIQSSKSFHHRLSTNLTMLHRIYVTLRRIKGSIMGETTRNSTMTSRSSKSPEREDGYPPCSKTTPMFLVWASGLSNRWLRRFSLVITSQIWISIPTVWPTCNRTWIWRSLWLYNRKLFLWYYRAETFWSGMFLNVIVPKLVVTTVLCYFIFNFSFSSLEKLVRRILRT